MGGWDTNINGPHEKPYVASRGSAAGLRSSVLGTSQFDRQRFVDDRTTCGEGGVILFDDNSPFTRKHLVERYFRGPTVVHRADGVSEVPQGIPFADPGFRQGGVLFGIDNGTLYLFNRAVRKWVVFESL